MRFKSIILSSPRYYKNIYNNHHNYNIKHIGTRHILTPHIFYAHRKKIKKKKQEQMAIFRTLVFRKEGEKETGCRTCIVTRLTGFIFRIRIYTNGVNPTGIVCRICKKNIVCKSIPQNQEKEIRKIFTISFDTPAPWEQLKTVDKVAVEYEKEVQRSKGRDNKNVRKARVEIQEQLSSLLTIGKRKGADATKTKGKRVPLGDISNRLRSLEEEVQRLQKNTDHKPAEPEPEVPKAEKIPSVKRTSTPEVPMETENEIISEENTGSVNSFEEVLDSIIDDPPCSQWERGEWSREELEAMQELERSLVTRPPATEISCLKPVQESVYQPYHNTNFFTPQPGYQHMPERPQLPAYQHEQHRLPIYNPCHMCRRQEITVLTQPCQHAVMCAGCAPYVQTCYACNTRIAQRIIL